MEKKKINLRKWLSRVILVFGILLILFPIVSQITHYYVTNSVINDYHEEISNITPEAVENRIKLAHAYNESLKPEILHDPFTDLQQEGRREYAKMLEVKENIGIVDIPKISTKIPIAAGTSDDILNVGAGHLEGTSLPVGGINTHTVITAHRGLPTARLFTDLDKVQIGDVFYIRNIKETIAYQVYEIKVVEPHELDNVTIKENEDIATLLTCTPYMINSHRLLVHGKRIPYQEEVHVQLQEEADQSLQSRIILIVGGVVITAVVLIVLFVWLRKRKKVVAVLSNQFVLREIPKVLDFDTVQILFDEVLGFNSIKVTEGDLTSLNQIYILVNKDKTQYNFETLKAQLIKNKKITIRYFDVENQLIGIREIKLK